MIKVYDALLSFCATSYDIPWMDLNTPFNDLKCLLKISLPFMF